MLPEPPVLQDAHLDNPYLIPHQFLTAHEHECFLVGSPIIPGLKAYLSSVMREIPAAVERSTVYNEILDSVFVPTAVRSYLHSDHGRKAYTTTPYDAMLAEGTMVDCIHSPERAQVLLNNTGY